MRTARGGLLSDGAATVDDSEVFVRFMLEDFSLDGQTTMVAPGGGFYAKAGRGNDEVRLVLNEADLARAMHV